MSNCKCGNDDVHSFMRKQLESGKNLEDIMKELTEAANKVEKERNYQEEFLKKYGVDSEEFAKYTVGHSIKDDERIYTKQEIDDLVANIGKVLSGDIYNSMYNSLKNLLSDIW